MNQTQALSLLKRVIGPKLGYRIDNKAPDADERERLRERFLAARDAAKAAGEAMTARRAAVLKADAEYQRLKEASIAANKARDDVPSYHRKRITVGRSGSLFFNVEADGDNWDEVVAKVCKKEQAA